MYASRSWLFHSLNPLHVHWSRKTNVFQRLTSPLFLLLMVWTRFWTNSRFVSDLRRCNGLTGMTCLWVIIQFLIPVIQTWTFLIWTYKLSLDFGRLTPVQIYSGFTINFQVAAWNRWWKYEAWSLVALNLIYLYMSCRNHAWSKWIWFAYCMVCMILRLDRCHSKKASAVVTSLPIWQG